MPEASQKGPISDVAPPLSKVISTENSSVPVVSPSIDTAPVATSYNITKVASLVLKENETQIEAVVASSSSASTNLSMFWGLLEFFPFWLFFEECSSFL